MCSSVSDDIILLEQNLKIKPTTCYTQYVYMLISSYGEDQENQVHHFFKLNTSKMKIHFSALYVLLRQNSAQFMKMRKLHHPQASVM